MDLNYLYSFVSFLIGLLAGFQGIYERYQNDSVTALSTLPGVSYLISRGTVPAAIFIFLYAKGYLLGSELFLQALACGTGAELVLRTRFYVKQSQKDGSIEELVKGPFDLLRWYQGLFLESIARYLAASRKKIVRDLLPKNVDVQTLLDRVLSNLGAWPNPQTSGELETALNKMKTEWQDESRRAGTPPILEQKYKDKLGYLLLNKIGASGLKTLLSI